MRSAANAIVLLGPPRDLEISSASGALPRPALALLAYLLLDCSGGRVSREEAGAFLWEDVDRPRQAGNLRQLLFRIRAAEAAADMQLLEATATQIALRPRNVSIDLRRFQAAIRLTNGANVAAACEAYSGELLAGLTAYSDGLASWLARERARLRADFLTALKPYVAARANGPVDEAAIVAATRILELDPRQEIAYQALIQAYLERGDATLANQYRHQREQADEIRGERRPRAAIVAPVEPDLAGSAITDGARQWALSASRAGEHDEALPCALVSPHAPSNAPTAGRELVVELGADLAARLAQTRALIVLESDAADGDEGVENGRLSRRSSPRWGPRRRRSVAPARAA